MTLVETSSPPAPRAAPESTPPSPPSLRARALRGSLWTALGYGGGQALRFGVNLMLQRLLFPEAFGTMAIVNTVVLGLHLFSDVGIGPSIIQNRRGDDPAFLNTAWTIQVGRGLALWLAACALAQPAAALYGEPLLAQLIPVAATTAVLDGVCSTKLVALHRHLALGRFTLIEIGAQLVASAVMLTWAWIHPTLWALVGGALTGQAFRAAVSHSLPGPRNRLRLDRACAGELLRFGKWIFASTLLMFVAEHCDRLLLGKFVPLAMLGVYQAALMVALVPTQAISHVGSTVLFSSFSRSLQEGNDLERAFRRSRRALSRLGGWIVAGMIAAGPAFVNALFDPRFHDAGWMLQLLAIGAWFLVLESSTGAAVLALGKARALAMANLAKAMALVGCVPLGFAWHGFAGALVGLAFASSAKYAIAALAAQRLGLPILRADLQLGLWVALTGCGGWWLARALEAQGVPSLAQVVVVGGTVTAAWVPLAWPVPRR